MSGGVLMKLSSVLIEYGIDIKNTKIVRHPYNKQEIKIIYDSGFIEAYQCEQGNAVFDNCKYILAFLGTLILMLKDDTNKIFYASVCGDNCAKWILKIAEKKDLTINLRHLMDFGKGPFEIFFENNKTLVKNNREYLDALFDIEQLR